MKKIALILTVSLVIAGIVLLALPAKAVFAQEPDPPPFEHGKGRNQPEPVFPLGEKGLERLFDKLVDRYEDAGYRIKDTDDVTRKLENRIEDLVEEGEDPSALEAILETFQENMDTVEAAYTDLGKIIENHAGFNAEGQVEDEAVAILTLRQIAEGLLDVQKLSEDARFDLRWDLLILRYQNKPEA